MKKLYSMLALMLSISLVLCACASAMQLPADDEQVTLRFSWWGSDNRHDAMQAVAELYSARHPNVTIECEYGAFDGWQQKVLTQLTGQSEPDVLQVNYNWVHSFGRGKNVFLDLNTASDLLDLSQWADEDKNSMTVGGQLAAVPHGVTARANLYNKALFADNGIEYPATYEEIVTAGAIIGKDNTPTGVDNKYVQTNIGKHSTDLYIAQMLYNATGRVMQTEGTINYTVAEVQAALEQYESFEVSAAFPTFAQEDPIQNESNPVWTAGNSGSVYEWIGTMDKYLLSYKNGEAQDEIGVAPYTVANKGDVPTIFVKPSLGFAISRNSKHPAIAADFLNFMFTDEEAIKTLGTSLGISSNAASRAVQENENMVQGAMKEGYDMLANYDQITMDPYFEDENVRGKRYEAVEAFRSGSLSAADAAKDFVERQQSELDKLYK